jgi:hypothetical protein
MPFKEIEKSLKDSSYDLKFLLNRGYRKKSALNFVANKYLLDKNARNYLARKVFSTFTSFNRRIKIVGIKNINNKAIFIDGYNVLITVESICNQEYDSIVMCDDGVLRDTNAIFGKYKINSHTEIALTKIINLLKHHNPKFVYFLYDSPVSKSGELAQLTNSLLKYNKLQGNAIINKNVDYELVKLVKHHKGIVATSDGAVMDRVENVLDIPCEILKKSY